MLKALLFIIVAIIFVPVVLTMLAIAFSFSYLTRLKHRRQAGASKPKGTVEILPPEDSDEKLVERMDKLKDRKVGKDKFRDL